MKILKHKHINTLQMIHQYNVFHPRWATSTHKFPVLYYYIGQQNEWIQPATHLVHFLFTLSHFLSYNHIDQFSQCYTTIHNRKLQCLPFIKGIPWENTTGFPKPWAHKLIFVQPEDRLEGTSNLTHGRQGC